MADKNLEIDPDGDPVAGRSLAPAALRALEEARLRREAKSADARASEVNGPRGPEPTRYGDWERNGLASDF